MSLENNDENKKSIQDQVRKLLSDFGGENGEFLSQSVPQQTAVNLGKLLSIVLVVECPANHIHYSDFTPQSFQKTFLGPKALGYFENFNGSSLVDPAGQQPVQKDREEEEKGKAELQKAMLNNARSAQEFADALSGVQALLDKATIENSHLKVAIDFLRLKVKKYEEAQAQDLAAQDQGLTQTALDFGVNGANKTGRRWRFGFGAKSRGKGRGQQKWEGSSS